MTSNFAVWAWKDEAGDVRYIGYGPYTRQYGHPASKRWASRYKDNSALHSWLQRCQSEPTREICGTAIMTRGVAVALVRSYRQRYSDTILPSRGLLSYSGGGPAKSVIYVPAHDCTTARVFSSVREAARETGVRGSTITRRCQSRKNLEWIFQDD